MANSPKDFPIGLTRLIKGRTDSSSYLRHDSLFAQPGHVLVGLVGGGFRTASMTSVVCPVLTSWWSLVQG